MALAASSAIIASLALATVAAPAYAATKDTCAGKPATIVGTDAGEEILGTKGDDVIVAGGGDDVIRARGGSDIICGGTGNDLVAGNRGGDRVFGGPGDDQIRGGLGQDVCAQGSGTGEVSGCEKVATRVAEPKSAFQTACEDGSGTYYQTYGADPRSPVCVFDPPLPDANSWNTVANNLGSTCGSSGGDYSARPQMWGCYPAT